MMQICLWFLHLAGGFCHLWYPCQLVWMFAKVLPPVIALLNSRGCPYVADLKSLQFYGQAVLFMAAAVALQSRLAEIQPWLNLSLALEYFLWFCFLGLILNMAQTGGYLFPDLLLLTTGLILFSPGVIQSFILALLF